MYKCTSNPTSQHPPCHFPRLSQHQLFLSFRNSLPASSLTPFSVFETQKTEWTLQKVSQILLFSKSFTTKHRRPSMIWLFVTALSLVCSVSQHTRDTPTSGLFDLLFSLPGIGFPQPAPPFPSGPFSNVLFSPSLPLSFVLHIPSSRLSIYHYLACYRSSIFTLSVICHPRGM